MTSSPQSQLYGTDTSPMCFAYEEALSQIPDSSGDEEEGKVVFSSQYSSSARPAIQTTRYRSRSRHHTQWYGPPWFGPPIPYHMQWPSWDNCSNYTRAYSKPPVTHGNRLTSSTRSAPSVSGPPGTTKEGGKHTAEYITTCTQLVFLSR